MIATGLGVYLRNGEIDSEYQKLITSYMPSVKLLDKGKLYLRAFYNYVKNPKY
jgi:hypothetical protein